MTHNTDVQKLLKELFEYVLSYNLLFVFWFASVILGFSIDSSHFSVVCFFGVLIVNEFSL